MRQALSLDYPASGPEERLQYCLDRPLDRYLLPLDTSTSLKSGADRQPVGPEEDAVVALERARESKNPAIRADYLQR